MYLRFTVLNNGKMEKNWDNNGVVDLGEVKQSSHNTVVWQCNDNLEGEVQSMQTSCGCTKPNLYPKEGKIIAAYNAGSIPQHLQSQGYFITHKNVIVTYRNNRTDVLTFKAKVVK